ncbi:MAG: Hsp33 family molecular chaperone HslO [Woeseiaceae bacterium]
MTAQNDIVMPFVFEALPIRGAIIQLHKSWHRMLLGHNYEQPVLETLGHSAAASALIAQSLKFEGSITLQISGEGPLAMLVVQCTSDLELRGMATAEPLDKSIAFAELVQKARCAITVDAGIMERPYQGIVEVSGDSLADSIENYYARSAQIPSHLQLVSDRHCCGGLLLQQLPGEQSPVADDWRRLGLLAATLRVRDVAGGLSPDLLSRLFAEDDLRVFRAREAHFRCRCSRERAEDVLKLLGERETRDVLEEQGQVEVTCEYCGRTRTFDPIDISRMFSEPRLPPSDSLH